MLLAILVMYVWAGATTAMAVVQFAEIRQQACKMLPDDDELRRKVERSVTGEPPRFLTIVVILTLWPLMLPAWIVARIRDAP